MRFSPKGSAYYRALGLYIPEEHVTAEDVPDEAENAPQALFDLKKMWNNLPFTESGSISCPVEYIA